MNSCLNLSFDVLIRKVVEPAPRNAAVSPLSLDAVLAMLGAGCSEPSELLRFAKCETVAELKSKFTQALDVVTGSSGDGSPAISFVNTTWIDKRYSFQAEYGQCLRDTFKIEANNTCDFVNQIDEAVKEINSWAESKTNGLIKNLVKPDQLKPNPYPIAVILANALYFKGFWQREFDPESTRNRDFHLINGEKIPNVPFMTCWREQLYGWFEEYKVLELPYRSKELFSESDTRKRARFSSQRRQFCLQIILPHKKDGLEGVLEKVKLKPSLNFNLLSTSLDSFWIPKFKFSTDLVKEDLRFPFLAKEFELSKMLQNVGGLPFVAPNMCQRVFVEVDEEGTEAAAVTWSPAAPGYSPPDEIPPPVTFVADHPFLFIIREKESGLVLFLGTVLNPLEE